MTCQEYVEWYEERLKERKENKECYSNFYNDVFKIELSETEARKRTYGHKDLINAIDDLALEPEEELPRYKETMEIMSDGSHRSDRLIQMTKEDNKNPQFLLRAHGFDSDYWTITNAKNSQWNMQSKKEGVKTLYSSKITVKPKVLEFKDSWVEDTISKIDFSNIKLSDITHKETSKNGKVVEVNFADVHIGKYVSTLVANGNYNVDIAVDRYLCCIEEAIDKIKHYDIDKIIYVIGQDYINFDSISGATTKGTQQDMNVFFEEVYNKGLECLIESVEMLKQLAKVEVVLCKGNHDKLTTFTMAKALKEIYKMTNSTEVKVDSNLKQRKYIAFGDVLLGLSHGEEERKNIFQCMQSDVPDLWAKKRKYFHLSHRHTEEKKEHGGVIYQWLGSLSESCRWTYDSGYVGSEKKGHVFVYDLVDGCEAELFIKA